MIAARRVILLCILGLLAVYLQGTLLRAFFPAWIVPNLLVTLLVFVSFKDVSPIGAGSAFLLGLELDLYEGVMLGPWAGAYVLVYAALASLSQRIFIESPFAAFSAVFCAVLACNSIYFSIVFLFREIPYNGMVLSLIEGALSGMIAPFVLRALRRFMRRYFRESGRGLAAY